MGPWAGCSPSTRASTRRDHHSPRRGPRRGPLGGPACRGTRGRSGGPAGRRRNPPALGSGAGACPRAPRDRDLLVAPPCVRGPGPPRERGPGAPAVGLLRRAGSRRGSPAVRCGSLRQDALLGPHGPAPAAAPGGPATHRARGADHAGPARVVTGDPPARPAADPPQPRRESPDASDRRLARLHGGDVGLPLLAAVRSLARGPARPRPPARPVPGPPAPVLGPSRRRGPGARPDGLSGPDRVRLPADAAELVPCDRHPVRGEPALPALRDARRSLRYRRAVRPAAGGRGHVVLR